MCVSIRKTFLYENKEKKRIEDKKKELLMHAALKLCMELLQFSPRTFLLNIYLIFAVISLFRS